MAKPNEIDKWAVEFGARGQATLDGCSWGRSQKLLHGGA